MHEGRNRTIDKILLIDVHIHVRHGPTDLLGVNLANLLPIVRVLSIEKRDI